MFDTWRHAFIWALEGESRPEVTPQIRSSGGNMRQHKIVTLTQRDFRSVAVRHVRVASVWEWQPIRYEKDHRAAIVFALDDAAVRPMHGAATVGDTVVLPGHEPVVLECTPNARLLAIEVPELEVRDAAVGGMSRVVRPTPLTDACRDFALQALGSDRPATTHTSYLVERLLVEMTFGILIEARESAAIVPSRGTGRSASVRPLQRARTIMLLRREDPAFGVDELAKEMHISVRQLERVYSGVGTSPARELRRLRAERADALLRDERYDALSIDELASHSGFANATALRRALSAEGLPGPRERRTARTQPVVTA